MILPINMGLNPHFLFNVFILYSILFPLHSLHSLSSPLSSLRNMPPSTPLSAHLPPLIMGTATFNHQFNPDPYALPTTDLIHRALAAGITAFDTSPYYGPAEQLLGHALATPHVRSHHPRSSYTLLTKVGRIAGASFDYSPAWIRHSVRRSLARLHTPYLDLVYCHDVEFVSPAAVLAAVRELRRLRDSPANSVRYVGISGYPVDVLADLAELVLRETGEPLDAVMSYANFSVQNERLRSSALERLRGPKARVDVVPNASPLGMGLLRGQGVPVGGQGDFHPAPQGLRESVARAARWVEDVSAGKDRIEIVAIRFALESWAREGGVRPDSDYRQQEERLGVTVMGVSSVPELEETLRVWNSILDGVGGNPGARDSGREWSLARRQEILSLAQGIRDILGEDWVDYAWASPSAEFVNSLPDSHYEELRNAQEWENAQAQAQAQA